MDKAVKVAAIGAMFVLLYDRDPATRDEAGTMMFTTLDGRNVTGTERAKQTLQEALAVDPQAWAQWLASSDSDKVAESMVLALGTEGLDALAVRSGTEALVNVLRQVIVDLTATRTYA